MRIQSYEEFWLFYVSEHLHPATRTWHAVGTSCFLALLIIVLITKNWWLLLLAPVAGYGPAWYSHFMIEKNKPATFKYPLWSLRADFRMFGLILAGRMNDEVEKAKQWSANHKVY